MLKASAAISWMWLGLVVLCAAGTPNLCAQTANVAEYRIYECRHIDAKEVDRLLTDLLPVDANTHLVCDTRLNRVLLRGSAESQRVVEDLLKSVDLPRATPAAEPSPPVVQAYPCPEPVQAQWVEKLRRQFGQQGDVRVTADPNTDKLFVLAPRGVQQQIKQQLQESQPAQRPLEAGVNPAPKHNQPDARNSDRPLEMAPALSSNPPAETSGHVLYVRSGKVDFLQQQLLALFDRRLQRREHEARQIYMLELEELGGLLEFQFDEPRKAVLVRGPAVAVTQFSKLIEALDRTTQNGRASQALRIERTSSEHLQKAVNAYRGVTPADGSPVGPPPEHQSTRQRRKPAAVRLVSYVFQETGDGGVVDVPPGPQLDGMDDPDSVTERFPGFDELEVETLPDLDVIILRGRDQDVKQLTRIIRELERLSAETRPKIYIYPLKHALGDSVKEIIDQVEDDLIGGRQGRVSVTPLVKPNSLLLIGWGDAVNSIITLIEKLDRPVPPESQFEVFSLKHASVANVVQTIQGFLGSRGGLGPNVLLASNDRTNSLIVYAAQRDMQEVRRLVQELDAPESDAVNQARIFRVYNALAADVADTLQQTVTASRGGQTGRSAVLELLAIDEDGEQVLRSGMLDDLSITPNIRNNTLIVTGPASAMPLIGAFIEQFDTPLDRAQIKVFRVANGDASNLVLMLRSLIPSQVGQPVGPQMSTAPGEDSLAPLRFSVEVRSNSIIAVGSEGDLRIVEALLTRLDESESMNRRNTVYLLKNSPAIDVATSVNEFLRSQRTLEAAEPGQSNPFQDLEREVIVVPEPVGNRLIVSATPRYFDEITELIEKLDEPPPQVMIQVLIAEILLNDVDEMGVELGLQDSVLFDRSLLGDLVTTVETNQASDPSGILTSTQEIIQGATNLPGFDFNGPDVGNSGSDKSLATQSDVGGQALSNFDVGRSNNQLGYGGLVLAASSRNVSVLIRALEESRRLKILSRPQIRTLDNQPAFIQVGQRVPRIIGSTVNQNGQSNSISLENVGLILGVTPRISPDGNVVMEVDAEKSQVGPEEEGIPVSVSFDGTIIRSPRVDTATAQATVSAANGETIILGGLISTRRETIERRAPFLSDIPVLGRLFSFDSDEMRRAELLIILTPHVLRNQDDSERLKQAEFARMSWCAADVYDLYGDIGLDFHVNMTTPNDLGVETIYPDVQPRGSATTPEEPGEYMRPLPYPPNDNTLPLPTDPPFRGPVEPPRQYPETSRRDQHVQPAANRR